MIVISTFGWSVILFITSVIMFIIGAKGNERKFKDGEIEAIIEACEEHIELEGIRDPCGNAVMYVNNEVKPKIRKILEEGLND